MTVQEWEDVFTRWSKGLSKTEKERAQNAERLVKEAINSSERLKSRDIRVFTQGSYHNNVNIKKESDVDIGVLCFDSMFTDYSDDNVKKVMLESGRAGKPAEYTYADFKNELEGALIDKFGLSNVIRGNKAFDVKENSYRVKADVAAFFEHRRYVNTNGDYFSGVQMLSDDPSPLSIINWPEQHYQNGVKKNERTKRKYKRMVRILKNLSNKMADDGVKSAQDTPSFLIECLVWNTPDTNLQRNSYYDTVRATLEHLYNNMMSIEDCSEWREVSELKYLFRITQPWSMEGAHKFIDDAWNYVGFR